jgi:hypothetical protein
VARLARPLSRRTIGALLGSAALFGLAGAAVVAWEIRAEIAGWRATRGTVVGARTFKSGRSTVYRAVVRFKTPAGEGELLSRWGTSDEGFARAYRVGQTLRVVYDPADPGRARIDSFGELWAPALAPLVPGLALLVASIGMLASSRRP